MVENRQDMKLTAILVTSLDGLISQKTPADIYTWTSPEDSQQFFDQIKAAKLIIMGSQTYLAARAKIVLTPETLRIVLTNQPEKFKADSVPNQLEFVTASPESLVSSLENRGYHKALLVGGSLTLENFLNSKLVTELRLTIEPILLGEGKSLLSKLNFDQKLKLNTWQKINSKGTLLLSYSLV